MRIDANHRMIVLVPLWLLLVVCAGCGQKPDEVTASVNRAPEANVLPAPSPTPFYIHLDVKGIDVGSTTEDVRRALGKPLSSKKEGENPCGGTKLIYRYDGLEITFDPDTDEKNFTVVGIQVTSPKWVVAPGISVGSTIEEVQTRFGGKVTVSTSGTRYLHYPVSDGFAEFRFRDNKLTSVGWYENLC